MKPVEAMVLLMCVVIGVVLMGRRLKIPYPIALVLGGLGISLIPGLPPVRIHPDIIFLVFLPPLLYAAAWFTSVHDLKANLRPILLLAVGLVLFTTAAVGFVVHALIPEIPLAVALALGAIVSPPDAVAATSIAKRIGLPKRIVVILEGESLVNDATGLVALRFALAAAASGSFPMGKAGPEFVWVVAGGVLLGLLVGVLFERVARLLKEDLLLITLSLLAPYMAYLPAERLHVSGVLAAVTAGLYGGWKAPELISASVRLSAGAVWDLFVFVLNCVVFVLIGLQLPEVRAGLGHHSFGELAKYGTITSVVVILVRPLWVYPAAWLARCRESIRKRDPLPPWQSLAVVSWCGMRGVVSLAAALALPITFPDGRPFPERDLVVFLAFCVILATLVVQGLSLPFIVRWLGVKEKHNEQHERQTRLKLAHAALARLNELAEQDRVNEAALQHVRALYEDRVRHLTDEVAETLSWSEDRHRLVETRRLSREAIAAERRELIHLRRRAEVDEELLHQLEREMDLEETRLKT
jgi:CPA1 family monovalent cation:H+ antiporter